MAPHLPRPAAVFRKQVLLSFAGLTLFVCGVAVSAAAAIGARGNKSSEQDALILGGISPTAASAARLTCGVIPAVCAVCASVAAWCAVYTLHPPPMSLSAPSLKLVMLAHIAVLPTAISAVAFTCLAAQHDWGNLGAPISAAVGLLIVCFNTVGIVGMNAWIDRMHNPTPLINHMLAANPVAAVSGQLHYDILREKYIYSRVKIHDYPFQYPELSDSFLTCGATVLVVGLISAVQRNRKHPQD